MTILPCLFPGFEDFHPLQFPGKVLKVIIVISAGSSSLWYPWQAGFRACIGCPALSPKREEGLVGDSSLSRCVLGVGIFAPPFDLHPELLAATPGALAPLVGGEALIAGLPCAGTGD